MIIINVNDKSGCYHVETIEKLCFDDGWTAEMLEIENLQSDFLKTPEHGDFKKLTESFIRAVNPYYAVITDSKRNPGNQKTYALYKSIDCDVYSTNTGNVYIKSDGKVLEITQAS